MFDIGFWELLLIAVVALLVLGPERLPHAIRSVSQTIRRIKQFAAAAQHQVEHELRIQTLHEDLKKAEQQGFEQLDKSLQASVDELKSAAQSVTRPYDKTPSANQTDQHKEPKV